MCWADSGEQTCIWKPAMVASNVQINASSHGIARDCFVKGRPHNQETECTRDDAWKASAVSDLMNTEVVEGAQLYLRIQS